MFYIIQMKETKKWFKIGKWEDKESSIEVPHDLPLLYVLQTNTSNDMYEETHK